MRSAGAVCMLAQLHDRGLVNARSRESSVDSDDSRLDSEAAKAVGQLRRTDVHISFARQLAGVMRESIAANARAGRSLLVATDRAPTADLLRLMLVPEGFRVDTVPLQEALSACATEYAAPDAMLVDWGSSQSDGIAIAKGLGRIRRLDAVRLVLIILA